MTIAPGRPAPVTAAAPSRMRAPLVVLRGATGVLMITAIVAQYTVSLAHWHRTGVRDIGLQTAHFLSAFTHEVNVLGGALLLVGAVLLARGRPEPRWYAVLRLCLLSAILVVSVVYNLLLRPLPVPPGSQLDWANEVMHVVAPALVLLEVVLAPHPSRMPFRFAWFVGAFPIAWAVYTFVRGPLVPNEVDATPYSYPYPFLNPHGPGGWTAVLVTVGALTVFTLVLGAAGVAAWRAQDRFTGRPSDATAGRGPFVDPGRIVPSSRRGA